MVASMAARQERRWASDPAGTTVGLSRRRWHRWRWLCRWQAQVCSCHHGTLDHGNHKAIRQGHWLWGLAPSVGCRTDFCLARALSSARKRLGAIHRLVHRLGPHRFNPHAHAQNRKALSELRNFRIRLSGAAKRRWSDRTETNKASETRRFPRPYHGGRGKDWTCDPCDVKAAAGGDFSV